MKVLTRTLTAKQAVAENFQRVIEHKTTDALRTNQTPRFAIADDAPEPAPSLNDAIRAAHRQGDDHVASGADVNGVAPAPSLNASVIKFLKGAFKR